MYAWNFVGNPFLATKKKKMTLGRAMGIFTPQKWQKLPDKKTVMAVALPIFGLEKSRDQEGTFILINFNF